MSGRPRDDGYQIRLGEVLKEGDVARLRSFLEASARRFGDARQVAEIREKSEAELEMMLHRMILARVDLADLHPESRRWLFQHSADTFGPGGERRN